MRVVLVHRHKHLLPRALQPAAHTKTEAKMKEIGVELFLGEEMVETDDATNTSAV